MSSSKFHLLCLLLLAFRCDGNLFAQEDSIHRSPRGVIGWNLNAGIKQMDFSAIRGYTYFLGQPSNLESAIMVTLYLGNPDKFFVSLPLGTSFGHEKKGNYDNYSIRANGSSGWFGMMGTYQVFRNNSHRFFKAFYGSLGINYMNATIVSKANGKGINNTDTSFFYEYSKAKNILINTEITVELMNINSGYFPSCPLTLKVGYNFQFQTPKWYYTTTIPNPNDQRNVNLGGLYAMIGINIWLKSGEMRSWFTSKK
jgi:hypothetical protein